jgi:hypothetical protein
MKNFLAALGFTAISVIATVLYYEGLHLPFIGQVINGAIAHRLEGYVALSEKTAAEAKAAREEHDRLAAQQSLEEARKREAAATKLKDQAHAELEKRIANDAAASKSNASGGGCDDGWNASDDDWVRHH